MMGAKRLVSICYVIIVLNVLFLHHDPGLLINFTQTALLVTLISLLVALAGKVGQRRLPETTKMTWRALWWLFLLDNTMLVLFFAVSINNHYLVLKLGIILGILCNAVVRLANHLRMPVHHRALLKMENIKELEPDLALLQRAGFQLNIDDVHVVAGPNTRLNWLGDRFYRPPIIPSVQSPGDLILTASLLVATAQSFFF
ncbi:MAG: DUF5317 family protein [bacterium]